MSESLWVRWVHEVYTKGGRWEIFNAPIIASCAVKDLLNQWIMEDSYSIKETYLALIHTDLRARSKHLVWNRLSLPKHRFVSWMAAKQKLRTKDKLLTVGVVRDDLCPLCGIHSESSKHLFFECSFSMSCMSAVRSWLGVTFRPIDKMDFRKRKKNRMQRNVLCAIYVGLIYQIWVNRNLAVWKGLVRMPQQVIRDIREAM